MKNIEYPYRVYIIALDQPWINWYGNLLNYYPSSEFSEVEDDEGIINKIANSQIFCADSTKNIAEVLV